MDHHQLGVFIAIISGFAAPLSWRLAQSATSPRLPLKGRAALDLLEYQEAYRTAHGEPIDPELLAQHIIATFLERDKAFQSQKKG